MAVPFPDHYAVLGLNRDCSIEDIRMAYRALAKQYHPDKIGDSREARERIQVINEAYKVLMDADQRRGHDAELMRRERIASAGRTSQTIRQDVFIGLRELISGTALDIVVNDPANPNGPETYPLEIPPETAPGARFQIRRDAGTVVVRVKARPDRLFKVKGSDLRCDLRINTRRATSGGMEMIRGITGPPVHVEIPAHVARGALIRVAGEGLPKARGGRGDLVVRIIYRPEVKIQRAGFSHESASSNRRSFGRLGSG